MKVRFFNVLVLVLVLSSISFSQFYLGAGVGLKVSGLKGTINEASNGQTTIGNVADAGKTGFNAGIVAGYSITAVPIYKIDFNFEASYSSFGYFEQGYNSVSGAGKFAAAGLSGGTTTIFSLDLLPLHRLSFPSFRLISPYLGVGVGINIMSTSDIAIGPPSASATLSGNSEVKVGLLVAYGAVFQVTSMIQPFIQFKHFIPFGSQTQFTQTYQAAGGGGSGSDQISISDVPGYFNIQAGCRLVF